MFSGTIRSNLDPFGKFVNLTVFTSLRRNSNSPISSFLGEYDDNRLYEVLTHVGLFTQMESVSSKLSLSSLANDKWNSGRSQPVKSLSDEVAVGGNNFSVGQRQLLVIARAMLTGAKIVIMDEVSNRAIIRERAF